MKLFKVPEKDHAQWWDAFGIEFFDEDAKMTMRFNLEDGPKQYSSFLDTLRTSQ